MKKFLSIMEDITGSALYGYLLFISGAATFFMFLIFLNNAAEGTEAATEAMVQCIYGLCITAFLWLVHRAFQW
jgi:hypothetical protein